MENSGFRVIPDKTIKKTRQWSVLLLTLLTVGGMVFCLQGMFQSDMSYLPPAIIAVTASLLGYWTCGSNRNLLVGLAGSLVALLVAGLLLSAYLSAGAMNFVNQVIAQYNYITGQSIDYFVVADCDNMTLAYHIFMAFVILLLALYISQLIYRKHGIILFLCWLPILAGGLYLKLELGGVLAAWAGVSIVGAYAYSQMESEREGIYAATILVLLFLMIGAGAVYYQFGAYRPSERIESMKENVNQKVEQGRYGQSDYPQGDLTKQVTSSDEVRLKVTLSQQARVYLKGYTGSVLEGQKWSLLEPTSYSSKYEGMIKDYVQKGFHPLAQLNCYLKVAKGIAGAEMSADEITVTVENVSAFGKYTYLPYGVSFEDLSKLDGIQQDVNVLAGGTFSSGKETSVNTYTVDVTEQDALIGYQGADWLNQEYDRDEVTGQYRVTEGDYRKFVEKNYKTIDSETKEELAQKLTEKPDNLSDITDTIRLALSEEGEEQAGWTSANYSTWGVMMFRYYDVPARYVEGYLAEGEGELSLTGADAHAWVEIYKEGVGWIPVDVTPGYYKELPQQEESSAKQSTYQGQEKEQEQQTKQETSAQNEKKLPWLVILLAALSILLVLLLLFVIVLLLYRQYLWNQRKQEMSEEEITGQLRVLSGYLYALSRYLDSEEEDLPEEIREIFEILWYSLDASERLGRKELELVKEQVHTMQEQVWSDAGFWKKKKLRYWKHMEYPV